MFWHEPHSTFEKVTVRSMSEETPQEDRTEEATPKRREEFRERGQVAKSKELASAIMLSSSAVALWFLVEQLPAASAELALSSFARLDDYELFQVSPARFLASSLMGVSLAVIPAMAILLVAALSAHFAQTGLLWSWKTFEFKPEKFNPINGIKRIFFSKETAVNMMREIVKIALLGGLIATTLEAATSRTGELVQKDLSALSTHLFTSTMKPLLFSCLAMMSIGALDMLWQRRSMNNKMKMSKEELKREIKQSEGDPMIAAQRKARHRELLKINKMIGEVATADVVINNPTHVSVALRYRPEDGAPLVVAKGTDQLAMRIREMARQHKVPMVTNVALARSMHKSCAVGQAIPEAYFRAVAEILARLWSKGRPPRQSASGPQATPARGPD